MRKHTHTQENIVYVGEPAMKTYNDRDIDSDLYLFLYFDGKEYIFLYKSI